MNQNDYYQILGVERDTPQPKIKEAYRKLAFQYHPDRNRGNPAALEKMKEINEAYAVLSDPKKRSEYDTFGQRYGSSAYDQFKRSYSEQDIFRGSDINQVFEEMAKSFGFRSFDDVFRESYGQGYRTFEFRRPGVFGRGYVFYGPLFGRGQRRDHQSEIPGSSPTHSGLLGKLFQYALKTTLGMGSVEKGKDWEEVVTLDPQLAQEGGKVKYFHRRKSKELVIAVPRGIKGGQKIRLKGMGADGKNGGEPGDLYLKVQIRKSFSGRIKELLSPYLFRRVP